MKTANALIPHTSIRRVEADGVTVFYREAGPPNGPVVLLLHGFPTSSFQYRELIPRLADRYRVIAPDLPGFGFTEGLSNAVTNTRSMHWRILCSPSQMLSNSTLRALCIRLRCAGRPSPGNGAPGASYCNRFAKRERVRRGSWRCLGPNPKILGRAHNRKPGGHPQKYSDTGRNTLAVHPRRKESREHCA